MTDQIVAISLENEMDLVLAHKRSMKVAQKLGLTIATQTTFATAVSEISRTLIEYTDEGKLEIGLENEKGRFALKALISFDIGVKLSNSDEGYYYAKKLVPEFNMIESEGANIIEMKFGLPRSLKLDSDKIAVVKGYFLKEPPLNAYEEIKKRNEDLSRVTEEQEEEIRQSKIVDDKKNEFMSVASHEIKTPITIIKAYTQMVLASKEPYSDNIRSYLTKIDYQTTKLVTLVHQMLDVSKMHNGHVLYSREEIELNVFINDMISVMKHIIPHHDIVRTSCQDVVVRIDKLRMEQVFSNLLGNAAKYSEVETTIEVGCELQDDGLAKISVCDHGIGMSDESMKSVFDRFYRDKDVLRTHAGLGMGLYIASKIVTDHGGKMWVESVQGCGSTFFFTIPYEKEI